MSFRSARALVASRRNLAIRGGASYCKHCNILIPDDFQGMHLKEAHGINIEGTNRVRI